MDDELITYSIPIFMVLIGLEVILTWRSSSPRYRLSDTASNVATGISYVAVGTVANAALLAAYAWVYDNFRFFDLGPHDVVGWVVLVVAVDFLQYVGHMASHRVRVLWVIHSVHHQSEEFNLAINFRHSWLTALASFVIYVPLAVLGFDPRAILLMLTIDALYQFWIHTRTIPKLGPLEWVLNTASHHRVHHGVDRPYIDKNYGGLFIVWDRIFGTFAEEKSEPAFGTVEPLASLSPVEANVRELRKMLAMMWNAGTLREALATPFMPPEWRPAALGGSVEIPSITRETQPRFLPPLGPETIRYTFVQQSVSGFLLFVLASHGSAPVADRLLLIALIVLSTTMAMAILSRARHAVTLERARLLAAPVLLAAIAPSAGIAAEIVGAVAVSSAVLLGMSLPLGVRSQRR